ncbi:MAG: hypothetical protein MdMp014T_1132 [Treponematales bacterium]
MRRALAIGACALALSGCGLLNVIHGDWGPSDLTLTGDGWSYDRETGVFTIAGGARVEVTGRSMSSRLVAHGTAEITLHSVRIDLRDGSEEGAAVYAGDGASLTLVLIGNNVVKGAACWPGVCTNNGGSVTIRGDGRLAAVGGYGAAGIGGSMGFGNGTVVIESGTIYAEGWDNGSGIGGGAQGSGGTIRINSPGTSRGSAGAHISRQIDIGRSVGPGAAGAVDVSGGEFWFDDVRQEDWPGDWPGDWFYEWGNWGN